MITVKSDLMSITAKTGETKVGYITTYREVSATAFLIQVHGGGKMVIDEPIFSFPS